MINISGGMLKIWRRKMICKIGIDTSSTNTAIVVLAEGKVFEFVLVSPKGPDLRTRCALIVDEVFLFVAKYDRDDCEIIIESPAFMATGKVIDLSMLVGGIFYGLVNRGYNCLLVPPTSHKKAFTGSGRASKEETVACLPPDVYRRFQLKYKKLDDLADAYSLASFTSS